MFYLNLIFRECEFVPTKPTGLNLLHSFSLAKNAENQGHCDTVLSVMIHVLKHALFARKVELLSIKSTKRKFAVLV